MGTIKSNRKVSISKVNKNLTLIIIFLFAAFVIAEIFATSKVGTKSAEVSRVRDETQVLNLERDLLEAKIKAEKSSEKLDKVASELNLNEVELKWIEPANNEGLALGR
ncbi:MAG: hypothetical protein Q9M91_06900 [Candidatus Dojkabacteria bacterium]|nr:hypothetical protein [Candidatus Dojkabacteria bacterium]MDQ7021522.1 hypothetical protein [Candidatus Dojkabacteria bacterium]